VLNVPVTRNEEKHGRNRRRERKFWHDGGKHTPSLGCGVCADRAICGGLSIVRPFYHCLDNCCRQPETCDAVCRNKPREFAQRVREVGGFGLENVPRAARLPEPPLPRVIPVLYHGNSRETPFAAHMVCLPLSGVIGRHRGKKRYVDASGVAGDFRFDAGTQVMLTGTGKDRPIERWWSLGAVRMDEVRRLRDLGVVLVTTPNFSLFTDRPRWDDMHSMKRIAITHEEFLREGVAAALHVNARTERDWERWTKYILQRSEVTHVAFEFTTGAGRAGRMHWHAQQLVKLAYGVGRPLHLVVRKVSGNVLSGLVLAFAQTTVLDTTSFIKTVHRQRAIATESGRTRWQSWPTSPNTPLDELLAYNWAVVSRSFDPVFGKAAVLQAAE